MSFPMTSPAHVAARLGRALTPDEEDLVTTLLADAERTIASRAPGRSLAALDLEDVQRVAATAVVRVLRNPDGYRSEAAGGVSYTIDTRAAAGFLTILDEEWALLGLTSPTSGSGAFSFGPVLGTAYGSYPPAGWSPWC